MTYEHSPRSTGLTIAIIIDQKLSDTEQEKVAQHYAHVKHY